MRTRKRAPQGPDVTAPQWEAARDAWIAGHGIAGVMKAAECDQATARELVELGDRRRARPSLQSELRAVSAKSDELERGMRSAIERADEQEVARILELRAKRALEAEEKVKSVLDDAGSSRVEEARLVRANRLSALSLANANARLLRVVGALSQGLMEDLVLQDGSPSPAVAQLSLRERAGLVRTIAQVVQRTGEASARAVQMERLLAGEPTHILGHQKMPDAPTDMTPEEAERWIAIAARVNARRAKELAAIDTDVVTSTRVDTQH